MYNEKTMPLGTKKWIFTKSVVRMERDAYGIYELLDSIDDVLYIGYGKISVILLTHFEDGSHPIIGAKRFSVEYTWDKEKSEARCKEELARHYEEFGRYPKFT